MLILEGPDMIGKTELASKLCRLVLRDCRSDKFGLPESDRMVQECRLRVRPTTVCDRCYTSEVVYGWTVRGRAKVSLEDVDEIERMVERVRGMVVVMSAPDDVYDELVERHHHRGEAFTAEECRAVNRAYRSLQEHGTCGPYRLRVDLSWSAWRDQEGRIVMPSSDDDLVRRISGEYARRQSS